MEWKRDPKKAQEAKHLKVLFIYLFVFILMLFYFIAYEAVIFFLRKVLLEEKNVLYIN